MQSAPTATAPHQGDGAQRKSAPATEEGVLVGWLVTYDEQGRGSAREIRSGRFFITGSQLRESDMVVPHHSVSTPHCLAQANTQDGIRVLDLMSKKGTFVKRRGTNAYTQHNEIVSVGHGDWLRLGRYDVLVCLVPTGGK